jgi:hypothetical protein
MFCFSSIRPKGAFDGLREGSSGPTPRALGGFEFMRVPNHAQVRWKNNIPSQTEKERTFCITFRSLVLATEAKSTSCHVL